MHRTRLKETRPFGKMLGDSVMSSIQTLLMIGGFIILIFCYQSITLSDEYHFLTCKGGGRIFTFLLFPMLPLAFLLFLACLK